MAFVFLSKRVRFSASHRLHNEKLSDQKNHEIFGKCNNKHGHGHNYELFVRLSGEIDPETGMLMSLSELKKLLEVNVICKIDHKHLNYDVDFMKGINPTAENLVVAIWNQLQPRLPKGLLYELELNETENNTVIFRGETSAS